MFGKSVYNEMQRRRRPFWTPAPPIRANHSPRYMTRWSCRWTFWKLTQLSTASSIKPTAAPSPATRNASRCYSNCMRKEALRLKNKVKKYWETSKECIFLGIILGCDCIFNRKKWFHRICKVEIQHYSIWTKRENHTFYNIWKIRSIQSC